MHKWEPNHLINFFCTMCFGMSFKVFNCRINLDNSKINRPLKKSEPEYLNGALEPETSSVFHIIAWNQWRMPLERDEDGDLLRSRAASLKWTWMVNPRRSSELRMQISARIWEWKGVGTPDVNEISLAEWVMPWWPCAPGTGAESTSI